MLRRACAPTECSRIESRLQCAFWLGAGSSPNRSCHLLRCEQCGQLLSQCTFCGITKLHVIDPVAAIRPVPIPPADPVMCATQPGQILRPPTQEDLTNHLHNTRRLLKRNSECIARLVGRPHVEAWDISGLPLPPGFGTLLHGACALDENASSTFVVELNQRGTHGAHNVILEGTAWPATTDDRNATRSTPVVLRVPISYWTPRAQRALPCVLSEHQGRASRADHQQYGRSCSAQSERPLALPLELALELAPPSLRRPPGPSHKPI